MRVCVVGATGVLGRQTIPRVVERGHTVRAVVRRAADAEQLRRQGVEPIHGDILDAASLARATAGCDAVLHLATAIPRPGGTADWARNDRIRREGTGNLLAAAIGAGARRYVQQSITLLYGEGAAIMDESAPGRPTPVTQSAADMEEMVQAANLAWCILRGGHLYGPGTGRDEDWRSAARDGTLRLSGEADARLSLIHTADFARAIVLAAEGAPAGSVYNVVDDVPVTGRELYGYIAAQVGAADPVAGGESPFRWPACINRRLRDALGWTPAYPSYRSGLA